jgi:hypothetical protein
MMNVAVAPTQRLLAVARDASVMFAVRGDCGAVLHKNISLVVQVQDDDDEDGVVVQDGDDAGVDHDNDDCEAGT